MRRTKSEGPPRLEGLHVKNYRVLKDVSLELSPLTVFLGPNGSGKSTLFDVFAFLAECVNDGLRKAWDRRGRFDEMCSRGFSGPIEFEIRYREDPRLPVLTYHLSIDQSPFGPFVAQEWLQWRIRGSAANSFRLLDFQGGSGTVFEGEVPDGHTTPVQETFALPDVLAADALGQLARYPRVAALRKFLAGWSISYLSAEEMRGTPEAGPQEHLSKTGDNLPNVIQYLYERDPIHYGMIILALSNRVPQLKGVGAERLADGRLLLTTVDGAFERPILAKWSSDGTLKMLAYLVLLNDPAPPPLIGIEEPENHLHPRLLQGLAEECRDAAARSQVLVSTHSPYFVSAVRPEELWVFYRTEDGFTRAECAAKMPGVEQFVEHGARLGQLWMEGQFPVGDPLSNGGGRRRKPAPAPGKTKA